MPTKVSPLIPRSKAKTAYGLVRDVQRAIRQEPTRANMGMYTCDLSNVADEHYNAPRPMCNTVGCFAGWISLLAGQGLVDDDTPARALLGPDVKYSLPGGAYGTFNVFNSGEGDACRRTAPGTEEHAGAVLQRIERFIQLNLKALKARRLPSLRMRKRMAQGWVK